MGKWKNNMGRRERGDRDLPNLVLVFPKNILIALIFLEYILLFKGKWLYPDVFICETRIRVPFSPLFLREKGEDIASHYLRGLGAQENGKRYVEGLLANGRGNERSEGLIRKEKEEEEF